MVAVTVDIANPVSGFKRSTTTDQAGKFVFSNLPPNPYHLVDGRRGFRRSKRDVDVRSAVPIALDSRWRSPARPAPWTSSGHAEDLVERDPTAHTDIDQSLIAKLPLESSSGPEPGHHARVAGRRRRLERVLPSGRRSRADAVLDRQPAGDRPAEPPVLRTRFRRTPCSRWRSSRAWRRPNTATRAASWCTSSPSPASTSRSRPAACRSATARSRARPASSTSAAARTRSATSCRSAACAPIGSSIRRSSTALHDTGQQPVALRSARRARQRHRHVPPQRPGGAVVVRRAEHVRPERRRPGAAPEDHHVQRRARLFAGHRLEDAVHRQRLRAPGPPDVHAERRSVRRHAGHGQPGPHADATWASRPTWPTRRRQPQREGRRHDQRDEARTRISRSASPTRRSTRRASTRTAIRPTTRR